MELEMQHLPVEILLADDNDDDILLVREAFSQEHLTNLVEVVRDGEEVMQYVRRQGKYAHVRRPGLILLDINMPKKNGFEVLQEIKADRDLASIPVIILTTSRREEDIVRSYSEGACSYVSKPVTVEKLREVVKYFALYWVLVATIPKAA